VLPGLTGRRIGFQLVGMTKSSGSSAAVMAAVLCLSAFGPAARANSVGKEEQKIRLDMHMASIEEDARSRRQVTGGLMVGMGAMFAAAGVSGARNGTAQSTLTTFWATSGVFGAAGIVTLLWKTRFERETEKYNAMPEDGSGQLDAKIQHAETHLTDFLESGRSARKIWGVVGTVLGATTGALYFARSPAFASDGWIFASTLLLGSGVASLFVPSSAEREAERYLDWKRGGGKTADLGRSRGLRYEGVAIGPLAAALQLSF